MFFFTFLLLSSTGQAAANESNSKLFSSDLYLRNNNAVLPATVDDDDYEANKPEPSGNPHRHKTVYRLVQSMFHNYIREIAPEQPTVVHMDILLLKVKTTIEKEGIFESVISLMIEWQDKRMAWNPEEFENVTFLSLTTDQVWLPDIAMTNSADHLYSISRDDRFRVRVNYEGFMKFVPAGTARTWCDLKLLTFPFDVQKCSLEFESWSLSSATMTFDGESKLLVDTSFASTQFQLCECKATTYSHTYNMSGWSETFTRLRFDFKVKRKSTFYVINLIFPCATLSGIQLLTFLIPSSDTTADRIGFGTTNLLTLVVFQTIITEEMPKTSDAVTALSKYVITLVCLSAIGILESVVVQRLMEKSLIAPPKLLHRLLKAVPIFMRELPAARRECSKRLLQKTCQCKQQSKLPFAPSNNYRPRKRLSYSIRSASYRLAVWHRLTAPAIDPSSSIASIIKSQVRRKESSDSSDQKPVIDFPAKIRKEGSFISRMLHGHFLKQKQSSIKKKPCKCFASNPLLTQTSLQSGYLQPHNPASDKWAEIAYKIDSITLLFCATVSFVSPIFTFLPLIVLDKGLCDADES